MIFLVIAVAVDYFFGVSTLFLKLVVFVSGVLFMLVGVLSISVHFVRRPQWCIAPVMREDKRSRRRQSAPRG
jgi:hypothetical protein